MNTTLIEEAPGVFLHRAPSYQTRLAKTLGPLTLKQVLRLAPLGPPAYMLFQLVDSLLAQGSVNELLHRESFSGEDWAGHLYTPKGLEAPEQALVYFHGGAFIGGGLGTHRKLVEAIAVLLQRPVLSVGYRQLPRSNFSHAVADCKEATLKLTSHLDLTPARVALMGDSAGGGLAVRVAGELTREGVAPGAVIGLSPWLDLHSPRELAHQLARSDAYIPASRLEEVALLTIGRGLRPEDSPLHSIDKRFPPLLLIAGSTELLRMDSEAAHARCLSSGVPVESHYFAGAVHAFPVAAGLFPETLQALGIVERFLARHVSTS